MLTKNQIRALLQILRDKYGQGYSDDVVFLRGGDPDNVSVGQLQAKLSIMLEVAARVGR